jgi:hypothetical protein
VRAVLDSVIERALGRPRLVRDRVLLAESDDGLAWRKRDGVHITHPSHRRSHMTYFTAFDPDGRLWVRASVFDPAAEQWYTELGRGRRWIDVRPLGLDHLYAPSWDGPRLYGVDGVRPVCFATGDRHEPVERVEQSWERIESFPLVQDLALVRVDAGRLVALVSAGVSDADVAIHRWESGDGVEWGYGGVAVTSPFSGGGFRLANNPSVVALGDGSWRMYFRTGERLVVGNAVHSAVSPDLVSWQHEDGARIAPGGRWDSHGAGFPHVWRDDDGGWRMHYAGYWGATPGADSTEERWRRAGDEVVAG